MDCGVTKAPIGKLTMFQLLTSSAAPNNWNIDHSVVVTTFLNCEVDNNASLRKQPEGRPHIEGLVDDYPEGEHSNIRVARLCIALYGLKPGLHLWY
jgi:hypothetical protein